MKVDFFAEKNDYFSLHLFFRSYLYGYWQGDFHHLVKYVTSFSWRLYFFMYIHPESSNFINMVDGWLIINQHEMYLHFHPFLSGNFIAPITLDAFAMIVQLI